jgi:predicted RNA-binding protein associated with RNAse of E/G family
MPFTRIKDVSVTIPAGEDGNPTGLPIDVNQAKVAVPTESRELLRLLLDLLTKCGPTMSHDQTVFAVIMEVDRWGFRE